jgi:hypothetical protein
MKVVLRVSDKRWQYKSVPKYRKEFLFFWMYKHFDVPLLPGEMTGEWKQLFDDNQVNIYMVIGWGFYSLMK